ncbi:hypothetical protein PACTADRAFT_78704 [Pachysolen tannophilus NRRL Y-2460]|uniref:SRP9 domain-containing protein n=1 Tax=Pachysolen tannophilus NRRL Y-2460 TaxID=669874 RepID=A0A1E4U344_PACTA|nr:hypothetical protein PACTADRAFT_78704 [Pachysolen tannophilus NRRL Y-2460]
MTRNISVDAFIERSIRLLEANASTAHVSITYGSNLKKHNKKQKSESKKEQNDHNNKITKNFVTVKTYDPVTGTCLKIEVFKMKEFSRILSSLGPRSINFTKKRRINNSEFEQMDTTEDEINNNNNNKLIKREKLESYTVTKRGMSSIMSNKEFEKQEVPIVPTDAEVTGAGKNIINSMDTSKENNSVTDSQDKLASQSQSNSGKNSGKKNKKKNKKR